MKNIVLHSEDIRTGQEKILALVDNEITIGQSPSASALIDDFHCNGIHALIEHDQRTDTFQLIDLGSRFGTFYRGKRIRECSLRLNDSFIIGSKKLTLKDIGTQKNIGDLEGLSKESLIKILDSLTDNKKLLITEKNLLQVEMYWGSELLELRTFTSDSVVTLGSQRGATFAVSLFEPELQKTPFEVAEYNKGQLFLNIPAEAEGFVWLGNDLYSVYDLREKKPLLKTTLRVGDKAQLEFGELTLIFKFVSPSKPLSFNWPKINKKLFKILSGIILFYLLIFLIFSFTSVEKEEKKIKDIPEHLKRILYDAGVRDALKKREAAIGQLAANLTGGRARAESGKTSKKQAQKTVTKEKKQEDKKPEAKPEQKKTDIGTKEPEQKREAVDVASAFSEDVDVDNIGAVATTGQKEMGADAAALTKSSFSRGTTGVGPGGGGQGVGIGQLKGDSTGGGLGSGDYGLLPSKGREIDIKEDEEFVIMGGLDPDIIAAIIRRYLPQIRYCYEQQLYIKPDLKGKVTASFVIKGDGSVMPTPKIVETTLANAKVEACIVEKILGWKFPKPRGGGTVSVKYPFLLMSNQGE